MNNYLDYSLLCKTSGKDVQFVPSSINSLSIKIKWEILQYSAKNEYRNVSLALKMLAK